MNSVRPGVTVVRKLSCRLVCGWLKLSLYSSDSVTDGWSSKTAAGVRPMAAAPTGIVGVETEGTVSPGIKGPDGVSVLGRGARGGPGRTRSVGSSGGSISGGSTGAGAGWLGCSGARGAGWDGDPVGVPGVLLGGAPGLGVPLGGAPGVGGCARVTTGVSRTKRTRAVRSRRLRAPAWRGTRLEEALGNGDHVVRPEGKVVRVAGVRHDIGDVDPNRFLLVSLGPQQRHLPR